MGLEDIINFLLKPVEGVARAVYGFAPATKPDEKGKPVRAFKEDLAAMGKDYMKAKNIVMGYTVKPMDRLGDYVYKKLDSYVFTPLTKAYQNHPYGTLLFGSLMLLYYFP
ncbi:hypothetical protein HZA98_04045 [Candidatus Woesearchaeota archaeon]|nr:hypothetical protein [Candidatus Woesearchaeota archaeon]